MFKTRIVTALAVCTMLFTACEKDQVITPDNSITTSTKSAIGNGDKSTNIIPGLQEFVDDLVKNNDTPDDLSLEDAVLFTEAALNQSESYQISLENVNNGIYFLKVFGEEGVEIKKLVKR